MSQRQAAPAALRQLCGVWLLGGTCCSQQAELRLLRHHLLLQGVAMAQCVVEVQLWWHRHSSSDTAAAMLPVVCFIEESHAMCGVWLWQLPHRLR